MLGGLFALPWLASAEEQGGYQKMDVPDAPFEEPMFTGNKIHMHLGLASIIAAAITGVTAPDSEGGATTKTNAKNTVHAYAAQAASALGGAAVVSGIVLHLFDIEMDAMDLDTLHMILTTLGTAAYYYASSKAPQTTGVGCNDHAPTGICG